MLLLALSSALAAGPQKPGHQATVGVGYSDFTEMRLWYSAREAVLLGEYRYTGQYGFVVSAEASTAIGERTYLAGLVQPWQSEFAGSVAVRAGYERRYFGLEIGLLYWLDPTEKGPLPSLSLWAGHPAFHLWTRSNPGGLIGDAQTMNRSIGLGSLTDVSHVELGFYATNWGDPTLWWNTEAQLGDRGLWFGVRGRFLADQDQWNRHETRVMVTLRGRPLG